MCTVVYPSTFSTHCRDRDHVARQLQDVLVKWMQQAKVDDADDDVCDVIRAVAEARPSTMRAFGSYYAHP